MSKVTPNPKPLKPRFFFREWRKHRGMTQEDLAAEVGVTASSISQLETGKQGWTDATLIALADALHCQPADLLMRNPLDKDAPYSLWEKVQKAPKGKRQEIIAVVETLLKTGTDN